ncbi:hypothetical protein D3C75_1206030 [compost metagenome]
MGLQRLALFGGLALDHGDADHQVAEQRNIEQFVRHIGREGQHIGGVVLVPPGVIELTTFGFIHQADGHFRVGCTLAQGQFAPAAELFFTWVRGIACQL